MDMVEPSYSWPSDICLVPSFLGFSCVHLVGHVSYAPAAPPDSISFLGPMDGENEDNVLGYYQAQAQAILDSKGSPYQQLNVPEDWPNHLVERPGTSPKKNHPEIGCLDRFLESSDDERVPGNTSTAATSDDDDDDDFHKYWPNGEFRGGRYLSRATRLPYSDEELDSDLDGEPCSDLDGEPCS